VFATAATYHSFVVRQQHYWPLRNYFGATRNKPISKGQRTPSTSVKTHISSVGMYITVKQLRPCCKSQLLNLTQGITSYSSSHQALNGETHANPKILK